MKSEANQDQTRGKRTLNEKTAESMCKFFVCKVEDACRSMYNVKNFACGWQWSSLALYCYGEKESIVSRASPRPVLELSRVKCSFERVITPFWAMGNVCLCHSSSFNCSAKAPLLHIYGKCRHFSKCLISFFCFYFIIVFTALCYKAVYMIHSFIHYALRSICSASSL